MEKIKRNTYVADSCRVRTDVKFASTIKVKFVARSVIRTVWKLWTTDKPLLGIDPWQSGR